MISRLGSFCSRIAETIVPDPFIFALLLTLATMVLGIALTPATPWQMVEFWMKGFWDLLAFGMQMVLILVTGGVLAQSPPVRKWINALADLPRTAGAAVVLVSVIAMTTALINWGLGLITGALLARESGKSLVKRGIPHHYPLLGAAGYTGLLIWHGGLSGSAPLTVATPGHFLEKAVGIIPVSQTLFSALNVFVTLALLISVPFFLRRMLPRDRGRWTHVHDLDDASVSAVAETRPRTIAGTLEESRFITLAICLAALSYLVFGFMRKGLAGLDLNSLNAVFLFLGFLFYQKPIRYVRAVSVSVTGAAGIILQFPFYAGIMGMMRDSGLVQVFSQVMVNTSNAVTFPVLAFLSGGLVNLFVPSGGGQWAVQGPILIQAAREIGVPSSHTVMALAYGDEWTNMLQPFWALPLLGITGLQARQIIGYSAALMLLVGPLIALGLVVFR
jgi:short-chain fatty acids transporter